MLWSHKKILSNLINSSSLFLKFLWKDQYLREAFHAPAFQEQKRKEMIVIDNIKDLPGEEWRAVAGYGGKYLVSSRGRIKSLKQTDARIL